jgi:hypothetical protein
MLTTPNPVMSSTTARSVQSKLVNSLRSNMTNLGKTVYGFYKNAILQG